MDPERLKYKRKQMKDYRVEMGVDFLKSVSTAFVIATAGAYGLAEGTNQLIDYGLHKVDSLTPDQRPLRVKEIEKRLEEIEKDKKKMGKLRERWKRLREGWKKGSFVKETIPGLEIQKTYYEFTGLVRDVTYWSIYASWWFTFFSLISTMMFRYAQSLKFKRDLIAQSGNLADLQGELARLDEQIKAVVSMKADMEESQKTLELMVEEIKLTGKVSDTSIRILEEKQDFFKEVEGTLEDAGLVKPRRLTDRLHEMNRDKKKNEDKN